MFPRVAQATFQGLLKWPDLMVFGLLSFALAVGLDAVFSPIWEDYLRRATSEAGPSVLPGLLGLLVQQIILTVGSILIAVAAARVVLSRLRGMPMSVLDGLRLRPFLVPMLTYSALYAVITSVLSFAYLFFLLGNQGLAFAGELTTTGVTGLTQVPTSFAPGPVAILLFVFLPALVAWAIANLLVPAVIANEGAGGWSAIVRSASLVRRTLSVVAGLIVAGFALSCTLALVISIFIMSSADLAAIQQFGEMSAPVLPELPFVMQAGLSALMFVVGAIFSAAWYLAAYEDDQLRSQELKRG